MEISSLVALQFCFCILLIRHACASNSGTITDRLSEYPEPSSYSRFRLPERNFGHKLNAESLDRFGRHFSGHRSGVSDKIVSELGGKSYDLRRKTKQHHVTHHHSNNNNRNHGNPSHVTHVNQSAAEEREKMWKEEERSYSLRR